MERKIKVLIVDDSTFARLSISHRIQADNGIEVIGFAHDGLEAMDKIKELKPDVITMDVEMPHMDGLTALKRIMLESPRPVIMLSSLTGKGTATTLRALESGAVDFFLKPSITTPAGASESAIELIEKIKMAATSRAPAPVILPKPQSRNEVVKKDTPGNPARRVVVIGSSTGGPRALYQVIPSLPAEISAAVLIIQHMPPGFTRAMAARLDELSAFEIKEAEAGDVLTENRGFIAPGGYHMVVTPERKIGLNREPPVWGVRPSVDVSMESVAAVYGGRTVGVVLTGMGCDGTKGTGRLRSAGGKVLAEDASTCVVYGMPRSVYESGYANAVLPLPEIAPAIVKMLGELKE